MPKLTFEAETQAELVTQVRRWLTPRESDEDGALSVSQASGQLSGGDLETMLGAVSQVLPGDGLAATAIAYAPGEARLGRWPGGEDSLRTVQDALERNGWRVRSDGAELTLQPGSRP